MDAGLAEWPRVELDEARARKFAHGNPLPDCRGPAGPVRVYGPEERLLGLGKLDPGQNLKPQRIFVF